MSQTARDTLLKKVESLDQMPTLPVSLAPLLRYLEQPLDRLEINHVSDLISQDKSLAAQCLHMANSPLFGRWQKVQNVRDAVVALGLQRMRDIAMSCTVLKLMPGNGNGDLDPTVFWEHSLGCALVCRHFASRIGFADPAKVYLAGLLHDIGIIVNLWILPKEFREAIEVARSRHIPLHEAEMEVLGLTHCESGNILAKRWDLSSDFIDVVTFHHDLMNATGNRTLLALVALSDLLCRMGGIGYGYVEERQVDFMEEAGFAILQEECPTLRTFDWARFTFELETYLEEVHRLVTALYRPQ